VQPSSGGADRDSVHLSSAPQAQLSAIVGNITSPYFGSANQIAGGQNGEGFYETANNRRLESQIKFTF
jgi:hypothetical protein